MKSESESDNVDPFSLDYIYSEPEELFSFTQKELQDSKSDCVFVLDANVLLLPYEFASTSLNSIVDVYKSLSESGSLKIPARAAREYLKHRSEKIAEIDKVLHDESSKRRAPLKSINFFSGDDSLKNIRSLEKNILKSEEGITEQIAKLRSLLNGPVGSDPISKAYKDIFSGNVVEISNFDKENFIEEKNYRYENSIPPGYKDSDKSDGGVGDLLIWKTILQIGRDSKKSVVFVTADSKGDWWTFRGSSERPRLELIEEFRRETEGCSFYLIKLSQLLDLFGGESEAVSKVKAAEERFKDSELLVSPSEELIEFSRNLEVSRINRPGRAFVLRRNLRRRWKYLKQLQEEFQQQIDIDRERSDGYAPSYLIRKLGEIEDALGAVDHLLRDLSELATPSMNENISSRYKEILTCPACHSGSCVIEPSGKLVCLDCGLKA